MSGSSILVDPPSSRSADPPTQSFDAAAAFKQKTPEGDFIGAVLHEELRGRQGEILGGVVHFADPYRTDPDIKTIPTTRSGAEIRRIQQRVVWTEEACALFPALAEAFQQSSTTALKGPSGIGLTFLAQIFLSCLSESQAGERRAPPQSAGDCFAEKADDMRACRAQTQIGSGLKILRVREDRETPGDIPTVEVKNLSPKSYRQLAAGFLSFKAAERPAIRPLDSIIEIDKNPKLLSAWTNRLARLHMDFNQALSRANGGREASCFAGIRQLAAMAAYLSHSQVFDRRTGLVDFAETFRRGANLMYLNRLAPGAQRNEMQKLLSID